MASDTYTIRTMTRDEVGLAVDWAAAEGWNPGRHDAACYYAADPHGFFVGLLDGQPIATISAVRYGASFGFVGFYIVKPECRGRGYGLRLWRAGMAYLAGRNVGLDGVVTQQDAYRKSGFTLAYRNIRYQGVGGGAPRPDDAIVPLASLPWTAVAAYDRPFFPAERDSFLKAWISQPDSHALGLLKDGRLAGYGVIRPCRTGWKIGPLYADAPDLAERLFLALQSRSQPSEAVFLDVPETNRAAVALAGRHRMTVSFETARMYTGPAPDLPLDRLFGVTSFEVG